MSYLKIKENIIFISIVLSVRVFAQNSNEISFNYSQTLNDKYSTLGIVKSSIYYDSIQSCSEGSLKFNLILENLTGDKVEIFNFFKNYSFPELFRNDDDSKVLLPNSNMPILSSHHSKLVENNPFEIEEILLNGNLIQMDITTSEKLVIPEYNKLTFVFEAKYEMINDQLKLLNCNDYYIKYIHINLKIWESDPEKRSNIDYMLSGNSCSIFSKINFQYH